MTGDEMARDEMARDEITRSPVHLCSILSPFLTYDHQILDSERKQIEKYMLSVLLLFEH
jgi:hypothetical protein